MKLRQFIALTVGRISARLPVKVNQGLWRALRLAKAQPIYRLTGSTHAGAQGTMLVAGLGPATLYLPGLFFKDEPRHEHVDTVSVMALARRLRDLRATVDLTLARVDVLLARAFFEKDYLGVPEWVRSVAPVPSSTQDLARGNGSLRQDLRLVRRHGFHSLESHDETELTEFYETMFKPHTVGRHLSTEYLKSLVEVKQYWRRGCLLWVMSGQERVAGMVVARQKETLMLVALGVREGDENLMRKGVLSAAYSYAMDYGRTAGCTTIDFGATRPSLTDGLLRYKRKWGAILDPRQANPARLLTYWPLTSPSIAAMLNASPLVFSRAGKLCAIHANLSLALPTEMTRGLDQVYCATAGAPLHPLVQQSPVAAQVSPAAKPPLTCAS